MAVAPLLGWGPFATAPAARDDTTVTLDLLQLYVLVSVGVTLTTAALVQERREALQGLRELALRDELTGLPNRRLLFDRLEQAASSARHDEGVFTVLLVDLDGFKAVNDTAGRAAGDELLVETARRLERVVRPGDTVARLGGDEFAVVCPGLAPGEATEDLLRRADEALQQAVPTEAGVQQVRASIGMAHGTGTSGSVDVLRAADAAMYAGKAQNRVQAAAPRAATGLPRPRGAENVPT